MSAAGRHDRLGQSRPGLPGHRWAGRDRRRGRRRDSGGAWQPVPARPGHPELRQAVAAHQKRFYGLDFDPDTEVLVTAGATEGIAAALIALLEPGDEAIAFRALLRLLRCLRGHGRGGPGAGHLRPPDFRPDIDALRAAITSRTSSSCSTPPQPDRGGVHPDELAQIASAPAPTTCSCVGRGLRAHGLRGFHLPIVSLPGMSSGRSRSARRQDVSFHRLEDRLGHREPGAGAAVRTVKQFLTYVSGGPFQYAVAEALALPTTSTPRSARICGSSATSSGAGLACGRVRVYWPAGPTSSPRRAPAGVHRRQWSLRELRAGSAWWHPSVVFYDNVDAGRSQVRFAFCKQQDVLAEALRRLARAGRGAAGQEAGQRRNRAGGGRARRNRAGEAGRGGAGLGD